MMEKINVAELLKDCPKGMELDCTIFDGTVTLESIDIEKAFPINIRLSNGDLEYLTKIGSFVHNDLAKCVIFPKSKTTWEGFYRPFKDGDIVTWKDRGSLVAFIYKERKDVAVVKHHFALYTGSLGTETDGEISLVENEIVFATEEEKAKLFKSIRDNGYKWNPDNKTLEKLPKFKVGDRIKLKTCSSIYTITDLLKDKYRATIHSYDLYEIEFERQDAYELVPNKFDITTLVPFESKVLVRDESGNIWKPAIFGCCVEDKYAPYYVLGGTCWSQCIPYEGNEHLRGKTDDCDEYFKNWK